MIVNVSSVATRDVRRVPYSAAKGGVNALTASLAMEHTRNGIRINATAPGGTDAPPRRVPRNQSVAKPSQQEASWYQGVVDQTVESSLMHRYGSIDEQVAPILFLAADESSYITGTVLPVGGGESRLSATWPFHSPSTNTARQPCRHRPSQAGRRGLLQQLPSAGALLVRPDHHFR